MFGFGKIGLYIFIATAFMGAITAAYYGWKRSVEQQALIEFNQKQMDQTLRDQQDFLDKQKRLAQQQADAANALAEQNRKLSQRITTVNAYLSSKDAKIADRPSSEVLKQTIRQLQGGEVK